MKINDIILDRFLNNDLPKSRIDKIKLLIKKDPKLRSRVQKMKSFESAYEKEYKIAKKTKMPKSLYDKISVEENSQKKYISNKFNNFYRIAAGILAFISISLMVILPNKTYLSQKNSLSNKNNVIPKIFYNQSNRDKFLSNNTNCSVPKIKNKKKIYDENNKEVFVVNCKID